MSSDLTSTKVDEIVFDASASSISRVDQPLITTLFYVWLRIGLTSFGGGAVTQYLIQEYFIHKHKWLTAEDYSRILAMSQITPGMGIIASTTLIGKQLGGWVGIPVSLCGLLLPSAGITVAITAIYARINDFPQAQSSLRALFASIFGIGLATNWRNVKPILQKNRRRGRGALTGALIIMAGSAAIYLYFQPPVVLLYVFGGLTGAILYWYLAQHSKEA